MERKDLLSVLPEDRIEENAPMKAYTTFRTGGPARFLVFPENEDEIRALVSFLSERGEPYALLGRGSNFLVSDAGYDGTVICFKRDFHKIRISPSDENVIEADAGALLSEIAVFAEKAGLTGFEFAHGIPGTLGGAVFMNAGAYGGEMKDVLLYARVMKPNGEISMLSNAELKLSYRHSVIPEMKGIVLRAAIGLRRGDPEKIKALMDELGRRRREKQPLEFGSAGSTFKRPEGYFAAKLIEDAGLKGYAFGDAEVSSKHAGFVVNRGNATSAEVYRVILHVQEVVKARFNVELQPEVRFLGEF